MMDEFWKYHFKVVSYGVPLRGYSSRSIELPPDSIDNVLKSLENIELGYSPRIMMVMYQNRMPKNETWRNRPLIYCIQPHECDREANNVDKQLIE